MDPGIPRLTNRSLDGQFDGCAAGLPVFSVVCPAVFPVPAWFLCLACLVCTDSASAASCTALEQSCWMFRYPFRVLFVSAWGSPLRSGSSAACCHAATFVSLDASSSRRWWDVGLLAHLPFSFCSGAPRPAVVRFPARGVC